MSSNNSIVSSVSSDSDTELFIEDFEYTANTPTDSINSGNLIHSDDDTNTVIIVDSDEELYTDDEHEEEYVIDYIYHEECDFIDTEKLNQHYYIGICNYLPINNAIIYGNAIQPKTFFKYSYIHTLSYLQLYSIFRIRKPKVDIMQLVIREDSTYTIVIKTHWLRIIQRTWRRIYNTRKEIWNKRMKLASRRLFELSGRYPQDASYIPTLRGMLQPYKKNIYHDTRQDEYLFVECH